MEPGIPMFAFTYDFNCYNLSTWLMELGYCESCRDDNGSDSLGYTSLYV